MPSKVSFEQSAAGSYIFIDGVMKGYISAGPECYISIVTGDQPWIARPWSERHTIARFKYDRPKTKAKEWCKTVFSVLKPVRVHELLTEGGRTLTPFHLALHVKEGRITD